MKYLNVGIAYEGGNDGEVIAVIARRILEIKGFTFEYFEPSTNGTMIIPYVPVYVRNFVDNNIDLAIFSTDQDEESRSRYNMIQSEVEKVDASFLNKIAIATPFPHIEAWLLLDDSVIKNILGMSASASLPYADLQPKNRFVALYNEAEQYQGSQNDLCIAVAQQMNLNVCCKRDANFRNFFDDIIRVINLQ